MRVRLWNYSDDRVRLLIAIFGLGKMHNFLMEAMMTNSIIYSNLNQNGYLAQLQQKQQTQ